MSDKPVTWQQGIAVVGGAFGLCCMGFMLLHGMVVSDRVEAAQNLNNATAAQSSRIDKIMDMFEGYRLQNDKDHKELLMVLMSIKRDMK